MTTPGLGLGGTLLPPSKPFVDYSGAALAGTLTAAAAWWTSGWLLHHDLTYVGLGQADPVPWQTHSFSQLKSAINFLAKSWFIEDSRIYSIYVSFTDFNQKTLFPAIYTRNVISAISGLAAGMYVSWIAARPQTGERTIRGGNLIVAADSKSVSKKLSRGADGIEIAPGLRLTRDRETKHFFIVGGTGSGKSVAAWRIITAAAARGDRQLIFDFKGITEKMPATVLPSGRISEPMLVCPWDSRSAIWDVAADVRCKSGARDFAARMVQESGDPMWSNSARGVLTGCVVFLQKTKKTSWTWSDLAHVVSLPRADIAKILEEHHPEALRAIEHGGKTADSILINLAAYVAPIFDLALAWPDSAYATRQKISFQCWTASPKSSQRTIIIRTSSAFRELSASLAPAIIGAIAAKISDLPDIEPEKNALWIVADEFPRLGKIDDWGQFLDVGRSKSIRAVTVVQTVSQIKKLYGEDVMDSWTSLVATSIFGKSKGKTAEWISRAVGKRDIERSNFSLNSGAGGQSGSQSWSAERGIEHISAIEVQQKLGTLDELIGKKTGVRVLIEGLGDPLIVDLPFQKLPALRLAEIRAAWAKPGETAADRHPAVAAAGVRDYAPGALGLSEAEAEVTHEVTHEIRPDFSQRPAPEAQPEPDDLDPFAAAAEAGTAAIPGGEAITAVMHAAEAIEQMQAAPPGPPPPTRQIPVSSKSAAAAENENDLEF